MSSVHGSGTDRIDLYVAGKAFIIADEGKGMSSKRSVNDTQLLTGHVLTAY